MLIPKLSERAIYLSLYPFVEFSCKTEAFDILHESVIQPLTLNNYERVGEASSNQFKYLMSFGAGFFNSAGSYDMTSPFRLFKQ